MSNITDYLLQLQSLTKTNLELLQTLNNSLYTKKNQLAVDLNGVTYAIPSFISLENKINMLQENFENLVNAPTSGEAYFNFDGDSRAIEVRSYNHTPHRLTLNTISEFGIHQNDIFKDFLTPVPYAHFDLNSLPNDITSVNVKKIIPQSTELIEYFKSLLGKNHCIQFNYSDLYKILSSYIEDVDYIEYDKVQKLPIRRNIGSATYVIERIINDEVDVDLDEYITIKIREDLPDYTCNLTYKLFDETICKNLKVGDQLVTWDSSAKMEVVEIRSTTNTIVVKLLHGEYLNLVESKQDTEISDYSKLRFYSPVDFDNDKYIQVPLEEDPYIFIAVAALNDRMNVQGPWGTGVVINTDLLVNGDLDFRTYYNKNVKNVGDILFEITSMMSNTLTKYSKEEYQKFISAVPFINTDYIQVTQINKHLNDSTTIKNIRSLYSQKKNDKMALAEVQSKIDEINEKLATISFDDTSNLRAAYTASLNEYNTKKNELVTAISKSVEAISIAANDAEVPIEAAKYRIRGFFDIKEYAKNLGIESEHICGIQVQYRYKNVDQEQGTAMSIGGKDGENLFIFSDWNIMDSFINPRTADFKSNYTFAPKEYNGNINEPSFNQIDIPISQGETVDIRLKVIYDYGRPFVEICSSWSEIINIPFPSEYLKDIQVIDIIEENNNDIETNRFTNIIEQKGIPTHINDKLVDQDITYYHKPESIASGFYTNERRIIPLKDKLESMNTSIQELKDEVMGTAADSLTVNIVNGEVTNRINPFQDNPITLEAYTELSDGLNGVYKLEMYDENGDGIKESKGVASTLLNLVITNNSDHTARIYSMFPGSRDTYINNLTHTKYDISEYCNGSSLPGSGGDGSGGDGSGGDGSGEDGSGGDDIIFYTFKIVADPSNATILLSQTGDNYVQRDYLDVTWGTTVYYIVRRNGYVEQSGSHSVTDHYTKYITLELENSGDGDEEVYYTFTIEPNPSDATVEMDGVVTNQVKVLSGTTVNYKVYKTGYKTYEGSQLVVQDLTLYTIHLVKEDEETYTINITPIPEDADVVINSIPTRTHTVSKGAWVTIHVSRMGYTTKAWTIEGVTSDINETVELVKSGENEYTYTLNPTPENAYVTLLVRSSSGSQYAGTIVEGVGTQSVNLAGGDTVSWSVELEGYKSRSGLYRQDTTENTVANIELEKEIDQTASYVFGLYSTNNVLNIGPEGGDISFEIQSLANGEPFDQFDLSASVPPGTSTSKPTISNGPYTVNGDNGIYSIAATIGKNTTEKDLTISYRIMHPVLEGSDKYFDVNVVQQKKNTNEELPDNGNADDYVLEKVGSWDTSYPSIIYREGETLTQRFESYNSKTNEGVPLTVIHYINCTVSQSGTSADGKTTDFSIIVHNWNGDEDRQVSYTLQQQGSGKTYTYTATQWGWNNSPAQPDETSVLTISNNMNGVWLYNQQDKIFDLQTCNQILTFRIKDKYDNSYLYYTNSQYSNNYLSLDKKYQMIDFKPDKTKNLMTMYPTIKEKYSLCMDSNLTRTYLTIAPHAEIVVPIIVEYYMPKNGSITKTMSFDIRTSLYQDPTNYTFSVTAKHTATTQDKLISTARRSYGSTDASNKGWIKYNSSEVK